MNIFNNILSKRGAWMVCGGLLGTVGTAVIVSYSGLIPTYAQSSLKTDYAAAAIGSGSLAALNKLSTDYANLIRPVMPAVVHIQVGEELEEVDNRTAGYTSGRGRPMGQGSGVIINSNGWIVTNAHVVSGHDKVKVILKDGTEYVGTVRDSNDPAIDVAVVKIEAKNLPTIRFGDSSKVEVGNLVAVVGAPLGFENTATFGHISATDRSHLAAGGGLGEIRTYADVFQTQTPINPGNSGGVMINTNGEFIGMPTLVPNGIGMGYQGGIGFALKSNFVDLVSKKLIEKGKITRGYIGVGVERLKDCERQKIGGKIGARVDHIDKEGPAAKAGIVKNDILVRVGSVPIKGVQDVYNAMIEHAPGSKVSVDFLRNGKQQTVQMVTKSHPVLARRQQPQRERMYQGQDPYELFRRFFGGDPFGEFPSPYGGERRQRVQVEEGPEESAPEEQSSQNNSSPVKLGVSTLSTTPENCSKYNIPEGTKGALVVQVNPNSNAETLGLEKGDVIIRVGKTKVDSAQDLAAAISNCRKGDQSSITFVRFGKNQTSRISRTFVFN